MIRILLKTIALVLIVFSVYFIVHPAACSNLIAGRVTMAPVWELEQGQVVYPLHEETEHISPVKEAGRSEEEKEAVDEAYDSLFDAEAAQPAEKQPSAYSQEEMDLAVARRYVELEKEYALKNKIGKDSAREIASMVMDDFEMSAAEWDAFISRATSSGLFNKVRQEQETAPASSK